jgi:hypothetical protein
MSDRLTDIQVNAAAYLNGLEFFSDSLSGGSAKPIQVITEDIGDVETAVRTAAAKAGIVVILTTPEGKNELPDEPTPTVRPTLMATVIESVTLNRGVGGSGQPVGKVAANVAAYLHLNSACGSWLVFKSIFLNGKFGTRAARDVIFQVAEPIPLTPVTRTGDSSPRADFMAAEDGDVITIE